MAEHNPLQLHHIISTKCAVRCPLVLILDPVLFNIHVDDINNCLLVQYADDTQFLHSGNICEIDTFINRIENTPTQIRSYFLENGLNLNTDKTQCIFLATSQLLAYIPKNTIIRFIRCVDSDIRPSLKAKNIGIYLYSYMIFDRHISEMINKTMGIIMFINRNKDYL